MSDAPAAPAPVTDNGVPAATQEKIVEEVPGHKVFVGNLAYSTTDDGLKTFFAPYQSEITSSQIILRGSRSAGYAFVAFSSETAAKKAADELDTKELDGRPVQVQIAKAASEKEPRPKRASKKPKSRRSDSKAPPGEVTEAEANGDATATNDAAAGTDEAAKPKNKKKKAKKPKKKAVDGEAGPAEGDAAADAPATEGNEARKPRAKKPRVPRRAPGEDPTGEPSKNMVFIANLGFALDDAGLEALFKDAGVEINSAHVVRRRWGNPRRSKGYGFVDVIDKAGQDKAVAALNNKDVGGRPIAVKVAIDSEVKKEEAEESAPAPAAGADAPAAAPDATVVAA